MAINEDQVREELKKVIDPELFVNIVDLGLIYVVDLQPNEGDASSPTDVTIEMTMTSPACPAGPQLIANSKSVVSQMEEVGEVEVKIVMDPPWTPDRMTEATVPARKRRLSRYNGFLTQTRNRRSGGESACNTRG